MTTRCFVGFGFGAIQAGLFLSEAFRSERFDRLVVAEVVPEVVESVRRDGGRYAVNVAESGGLRLDRIEGVEILNPLVAEDRAALVDAAAEASEMATALPSVDFFDKGDASVAAILAEAAARKMANADLPRAIVYAGENNNQAAELLVEAVERRAGAPVGERLAALNTVIGKMSGVVIGEEAMGTQGLEPMTSGAGRAFLVEAFNRILVSRVPWEGFERGIGAFEEKDDLLPFEEAKLYGHNATHALIGYLALEAGHAFMSDAGGDEELMALARAAFLKESGRGLIARHGGIDPLFTEEGYRDYADDLLVRMVNPHLRDAVDRIVRDPQRKLGWHDRLVGTMRMAMEAGLRPWRYATGAASALRMLEGETGEGRRGLVASLWGEASSDEREDVMALIEETEKA